MRGARRVSLSQAEAMTIRLLILAALTLILMAVTAMVSMGMAAFN